MERRKWTRESTDIVGVTSDGCNHFALGPSGFPVKNTATASSGGSTSAEATSQTSIAGTLSPDAQAWVDAALDAAPPLSAEQRDRLAEILSGVRIPNVITAGAA